MIISADIRSEHYNPRAHEVGLTFNGNEIINCIESSDHKEKGYVFCYVMTGDGATTVKNDENGNPKTYRDYGKVEYVLPDNFLSD